MTILREQGACPQLLVASSYAIWYHTPRSDPGIKVPTVQKPKQKGIRELGLIKGVSCRLGVTLP